MHDCDLPVFIDYFLSLYLAHRDCQELLFTAHRKCGWLPHHHAQVNEIVWKWGWLCSSGPIGHQGWSPNWVRTGTDSDVCCQLHSDCWPGSNHILCWRWKRMFTWRPFLTDAHWCYILCRPLESSLYSLLRKVLNPELETTDLLFLRERIAPSWSWQFVWLVFLPCLTIWTSCFKGAQPSPSLHPGKVLVLSIYMVDWVVPTWGGLHSSSSWVWEPTCCS